MKQSGLCYLLYSPYYSGEENWSDEQWESYDTYINQLEPRYREILTSAHTTTVIAALLANNGLTTAHGKKIALIIREIILGRIALSDLAQTIQTTLGTDQILTASLAKTIIDQIFNTAPSVPKQTSIPGQDLPESGGNVINLRDR